MTQPNKERNSDLAVDEEDSDYDDYDIEKDLPKGLSELVVSEHDLRSPEGLHMWMRRTRSHDVGYMP